MASSKFFLVPTLAALFFSCFRRLLATMYPGVPDPTGTTSPGFQGTTEPGNSFPCSTFPGSTGFGSTRFPGGFPGAGFPGSVVPGFFNPQFLLPFFRGISQPKIRNPGYPGGAPAFAGTGGPYGLVSNPPQMPNAP